MMKHNHTYHFISILLIISMLASLFPLPAAAQQRTSQPSSINSGTSAYFSPFDNDILPSLGSNQLTSVESFNPNNLLINPQPLQQVYQTSSLPEPQTFFNPITIARTQSSYLPLSGVLIITYTVKNNRPPAQSVAIDPQTATITDTLQLFNTIDLTNDPNVIHNVFLSNELNLPNIALLSASLMPDHRDNTLAWNLGNIPPLQSVVVTLSLEIPTTVTGFTQLDTGASVWGTLQGQMVSAQAAPSLLVPDTFADSLACTIDANCYDPYVIEKAASLGNDPTAIFEFVRSQVDYESYAGSLRGARGTLWSFGGNSVDQASLLIALLRASGIPA
ncbi:MAG: transglutaminase family protein, partial [Chloroflexota bacterium]